TLSVGNVGEQLAERYVLRVAGTPQDGRRLLIGIDHPDGVQELVPPVHDSFRVAYPGGNRLAEVGCWTVLGELVRQNSLGEGRKNSEVLFADYLATHPAHRRRDKHRGDAS